MPVGRNMDNIILVFLGKNVDLWTYERHTEVSTKFADHMDNFIHIVILWTYERHAKVSTKFCRPLVVSGTTNQ